VFNFRLDSSYGSYYATSTFIAGVVVSLMVIPIVTSLSRQVFSQAPRGEREGAYALGATRWGMIRAVVLPFGRAGVIGATMLGLGRALGETIAVTLIITPVFHFNFHVLETGGNSIAATIALDFSSYPDAGSMGLSALMAAGLVLFGMTLIVNMLGAVVIGRSRSGLATAE
jgi:phosphate transport system permease protein